MACAALVVFSLLLVQWMAAEPEYQGRSLSEWVDDLQNGKPEAKAEARAALAQMGPAALSYLTRELTRPPTPVQRAAGALSQYVPKVIKAPLQRIYSPSHEIVEKYAALNAIRSLGTNGTAAVAPLTQVFFEPHQGLSSAAAEVLGTLGTNALPVFIAALDHGDYNVRASACHGLASLQTNAAPAIPRLERIAREEIGPIASTAFYTLSRVGPAAVPALIGLTANTNSSVRSQAIYSLGSIGPRAAEAEDALLLALQDPVAEVRWRAIESLTRIAVTSPRVIEPFIAALDDPNPSVRATAAHGLSFRRRIVHQHLEKFFSLLEDESPGVRGQAALALGQTAELGEPAIGPLEKLVTDTNEVVSANARQALETISNSLKYAEAHSTPSRAK